MNVENKDLIIDGLKKTVEIQQNKIEKLNRVVSILSKRNEKYYKLKDLLQDILSED